MSQALYFLGRDLCAREFRVKNGASAEKSLLTADPTEMLVDLFGWSENFYSICRSRKRSQKQQGNRLVCFEIARFARAYIRNEMNRK